MVRFILFGCILYRLDALQNSVQNEPKLWKSLCHEVVAEFFANKRTRSTPLYPNLMFRCISYYLGVFGTVWLCHKTQCKTAQSGAKVRAMKLRRNFFATNAPDPPHRTLNSCFGVFCTIWVHSIMFGCLTKLGAQRGEVVQKFVSRSCIRIFLQQTHPIHPIRPYTNVLVRFILFGCIRDSLVALRNSMQNGPN